MLYQLDYCISTNLKLNIMEYKSLDKYELKGRGTVYIVENEIERDRCSNNLIGIEVLLLVRI